MTTKLPRIMISVTEDMYNEIEKYRKENHFLSISEATRDLMRIGLDSLDEANLSKEDIEKQIMEYRKQLLKEKEESKTSIAKGSAGA